MKTFLCVVLILLGLAPSASGQTARDSGSPPAVGTVDDPNLGGDLTRILGEYQQYAQQRLAELPRDAATSEPPVSRFSTLSLPLVRVMPSSYQVGSPGTPSVNEPTAPHTWPGRALIVWGRVDGGVEPYTFEMDFGDGTPPVTGTLDYSVGRRPGYIAEPHVYSTAGPKIARLTVTDNTGSSSWREAHIYVEAFNGNERDHDLLVRRNAAIQDGLRWLYLKIISGSLYSYAPYAAAGLASFEINGHYPDSTRWETDIYAEFVRLGLEWMLTTLSPVTIFPQPWGNPDSNGNGQGIACTHTSSAYEQGLIMYALALSRFPDGIVQGGPFAGWTYRNVLTDMVDQLAWNQGDSDYCEGGWRYSVWHPGCESDNSAVQWATIALDAAERPQNGFGVAAAGFVKTELRKWLNYSRCSDGGYGYTGPNNWCNAAKTGSGMFSEFYCGLNINVNDPEHDPVIMASMNALNANWCGYEQWPNYYAMYAVKKALADMQIDLLAGSRDWYEEYCHFLIPNYTGIPTYAGPCGFDSWHQVVSDAPDVENEGFWPGDWAWLGDGRATTSWAVLILTPGISCDLFAEATATPQGACPHTPITFDGRSSHSTCPDRQVVAWLWDFDSSNGANIQFPDASGDSVTRAGGYDLPAGQDSVSYVATLWVIDQGPNPGDLPDTASTQVNVTVSIGNHPPVARLNGPFTACVGEPIWLDACASFDPDRGESGCPPDSVVLYEWDLGGDGSIDITTTVCRAPDPLVFNTEMTMSVSLWVTDSHGVRSLQADAALIWSSFRDLTVRADEITFDPPAPGCMAPFEICVPVHTTVQGGAPPIAETKVRVYHDQVTASHLICEETLLDLQDGQVSTVCCTWAASDSAEHTIIVVADADQQVQECLETDNRVARLLPPCSPNGTPECSSAVATVGALWPPNHRLAEISIVGGSDPDGDPFVIRVIGITQDEGLDALGDGATCPDGVIKDGKGFVRVERSGTGNGRVYRIIFVADDGKPNGVSDPCTLTVCVPHDLNKPCVEDPLVVNSLEECDLLAEVEEPVREVGITRVVLNGSRGLIEYGLPAESEVSLAVYDISGRVVARLASGRMPAGRHEVTFDTGRLAGGVYFCRLRAGKVSLTRSLLILK